MGRRERETAGQTLVALEFALALVLVWVELMRAVRPSSPLERPSQ